MKLVLNCDSSHDDCCGCDYALVNLTPKTARHLLDRLEAFLRFREAAGVWEARWFDGIADYFSPWGDASGADPDQQSSVEETERMVEVLSALANGEPLMEVADDFEIPDRMAARTECDTVVVRDHGIVFACYPKHTSVRITTETIPIETLREAASAQRLEDQEPPGAAEAFPPRKEER